MQIVSIENGMVKVEVPVEYALDIGYDEVRAFVLAETGHEIAGPENVEEKKVEPFS